MGMRPLPRRIRSWFRSGGEIEAEVAEEIRFHLEMRTARLEREGLTRREAEEQARREFGDAGELHRALTRRDTRTERRRSVAVWLSEVRQDVRFAWRGFMRAPAFTLVAVSTLALGIGAAVAMFTVLNAVVLRPLPYPDADRLVEVWPGNRFNISLADAVVAGSPSLEVSTAISQWGLTLSGGGDAVELQTQIVDAGFFPLFGVKPVLGRTFRADERDPSSSGVVLLSYGLWQSRFGADPSVIGTRVQLDGYGHRSREVVGVMPRGFEAPLVAPGVTIDLWTPLHLPSGRTVRTDSTWYGWRVIARLRDGATVTVAAGEVTAALTRVREESGRIVSEESLRQAGAMGLLDSLVGETRELLWLLLGAVSLVLLLACANLVNLQLARGERRRAELAARAALGGTRIRLVRELLTESVLLAAIGAASGIVLARVILSVLRIAESAALPRAHDFTMDARVAAFAIVVSALAVLVFGLLPAVRVTGGDLRPALGAGRRTAGTTVAGRQLGSLLIICEVVLATLLVTGAALLLASFRSIRATNPGIDTHDVLAMRLAPSVTDYDGARSRLLYDELLAGVRALPGVHSAGAIHLLPFTQNNWNFPYLAAGHAPPVNAPLPSANFRVVTTGYFDATDVRVIAGRAFDDRDVKDAPAVGMINRTFAELLWPGQSAVGREIALFGNVPFRVIGVVDDVHQHGLRRRPEPEMYRPLTQWTLSTMVLMVEADRDAGDVAHAVRGVVRVLDAKIPITESRPLAVVLDESLARDRFFAGVLVFFGLIALVLGAVGVYGVMSYAVSARVPEFGVRLALGATHRRVVTETLRAGALPIVIGLIAGTAASLLATRLLDSLLFGVEPRDPLLLGAAAFILGATALLACWLPVRRVRRVQPMTVLKSG
jgi:putative ABC transport system permease protein